MSANIFYRPLKDGKTLSVLTPSNFIKKLCNAFGNLPLQLDSGHYDRLVGMGLGASEESESEAFKELAEAIEKFKQIEVYSRA